MDNMLDDIEKVVDDFSLDEKEEKPKWRFEDFAQKMLNERLELVIKEQHRESELRREREEFDRRVDKMEYEKAMHSRIPTQRSHIDLRNQTLGCESCGHKMEIVYKINIDAEYNYYDDKFVEQAAMRNERHSNFYCGFCGRNYRIVGEVISVKNY